MSRRPARPPAGTRADTRPLSSSARFFDSTQGHGGVAPPPHPPPYRRPRARRARNMAPSLSHSQAYGSSAELESFPSDGFPRKLIT
ncbi:Hypothetical protein NTJ_16083 [Nesidiocoris tenuis]|nr:Hypothetical protein NTJ_16083 [Nesidiocoris tenuis]